MKRFTETTKWNDPWFRKLTPKMKTFWAYICDVCDPAGVWVVDFELATFFIGETVSEPEALESLKGRVVDLKNGKWVIAQFIQFQYGKLSKDCRPHDRVFEALSKHKLKINPDTLALGYPKGIQRVSDNLEEEEENKEEDRNGESEGKKLKALVPAEGWDFPQNLRTEKFIEKWGEWVLFRRTKGGIKDWALFFQGQLKWLGEFSEPIAFEMVERSLVSGWTGIFRIKENEKHHANNRPCADRNKGTFNEGKASQYDELSSP